MMQENPQTVCVFLSAVTVGYFCRNAYLCTRFKVGSVAQLDRATPF